MIDKTQPDRQRRYRAKLRAQLVKASLELPARIAELETENAELQRRLASSNDSPAQPSLLDRLAPDARAEFDRLHAGLRGRDDAEKLVDLIERALHSYRTLHLRFAGGFRSD